MYSGEKERVAFVKEVNPTGLGVEEWMTDVETQMYTSIRKILYDSIADYPNQKRTDWVKKW